MLFRAGGFKAFSDSADSGKEVDEFYLWEISVAHTNIIAVFYDFFYSQVKKAARCIKQMRILTAASHAGRDFDFWNEL